MNFKRIFVNFLTNFKNSTNSNLENYFIVLGKFLYTGLLDAYGRLIKVHMVKYYLGYISLTHKH